MAGKILIADNAASERIVLKAWLANLAFDIVQADSASALFKASQAPDIDLIVLPNRLDAMDAIALLDKLRTLTHARSVPVILRLSQADFPLRLRALQAGIDAVIDTSTGPALLTRARAQYPAPKRPRKRWMRAAETASVNGFQEPRAAFAAPASLALITARLEEGLVGGTALASICVSVSW